MQRNCKKKPTNQRVVARTEARRSVEEGVGERLGVEVDESGGGAEEEEQ